MKWFRFYNEVLEDPKVQCLTPELFKFWINVLCIACKNEGILPNLEAVAYHIRATTEATQRLLNALLEAQLLQEFSNQHGKWLAPHSWAKRQYKSDISTDRVKRFRNGNRNDVVTPPETEADTEQRQIKKEKKGENFVLPLPEWLPIPDWNDYLDSRSKRGKKATIRAMQLVIIKLDELRIKGHDPTAVLQQSTMNGWTSVFEIKEQNNANKTGFAGAYRSDDSNSKQPHSSNRDRLMSAIFEA